METENHIKNRMMCEFMELMPMLRARLGLTQEQLGRRIGTTRQTIIAMESKKRKATWSTFLSLVFVFYLDARTRPHVTAAGIVGDELSLMLFDDANLLRETQILLDQGREKQYNDTSG